METRLRRRERDRIAIIAEILEMARGGVLKSNIMWRAGLSYEMLNGYVGLMMNAKLLDKVPLKDKVIFKATDRGMRFLYHCHEIMELLEAEDDGHEPNRRIQLLPSSLSQDLSPRSVLMHRSTALKARLSRYGSHCSQ